MAQKILDKFDSEEDFVDASKSMTEDRQARKDEPELTADVLLDDTKKVTKHIDERESNPFSLYVYVNSNFVFVYLFVSVPKYFCLG